MLLVVRGHGGAHPSCGEGDGVRRDDFRKWLAERKTSNSVNTYTHGLKRFEEVAAKSRGRAIDLDAEWAADRFADLCTLIGEWRADH